MKLTDPIDLGASRARIPVLLLGEALIDRFVDVDVVGGAPFNVARSLAAFGVPTTLVTRIGAQDDGGRLVWNSALRFGLSGTAIQRDPNRSTGVVTVGEQNGDHRFEIHGHAAWDHIALRPARAAMHQARPGLIYFGTLAQRQRTSARTIRALLDETRAIRFLDLNLRSQQKEREVAAASLIRADWVKVNEAELRTLLLWYVPSCDAGAAFGSADIRRGIIQLMHSFSLARLVVTRGDGGYAAFDTKGRCFASAGGVAVPRRVVDTVGAGDAFSAALLAGWSAGFSFRQALGGANRYAAAICGERGPLPQDPEFFRAWRSALRLVSPTLIPMATG